MKRIGFALLVLGFALARTELLAAQEYKLERTIGHAPQVGEPRGLAVDALGNVYVSDRINGRILTLVHGSRLAKQRTEAFGKVDQPSSLAMTPDGGLAVAQEGTGEVRVYTPAGRLKQSFSIAEKPGA